MNFNSVEIHFTTRMTSKEDCVQDFIDALIIAGDDDIDYSGLDTSSIQTLIDGLVKRGYNRDEMDKIRVNKSLPTNK